jgi:hypothetical protein
MHKRLAVGIGAIVFAGAVAAGPASAGAATVSPRPGGSTALQPVAVAQASGLASTIALNNCSAALVRYPTSLGADRALMLTNGHCYEGGMPAAGQVLQNRPSSRSGRLLDSAGKELGTVRADKVIYATMTKSDVTLYQLTETFAALSSRLNATALTISASHPADGASVTIPSGYWKRVWTCQINGFVSTLREGQWTWHDSIRYDKACNTIHGTSGSPIVDAATGNVIGINNTGNDNGATCTLNNPCEVDQNGNTTVRKGQSYGEETYWFTTCLTPANAIDLSVRGCLLAKPASRV